MMNNKALKDAVADFIKQLGYVPLDMQVQWSQEEWKVRCAIFRQVPVTLSDCATVTRALKDYLFSWLGNEDFSLDISSPGAERILKTPVEYSLFQGKRAKVVFKSGLIGFFLLISLDESEKLAVMFSEEKQAVQSFPLQDIAKCQLVL